MIRTLYELYRARCHDGGNINEHLPLLYMLSLQSDGVAELGIDRGISTSALLSGQEQRSARGLPARYIGVDINGECLNEVIRLRKILKTPVVTEVKSESSIRIQPIPLVDLMLIDSEHTETHIKKELALHANSVRRFIALHDTVTFGENGEKPGSRGILYGIDVLLSPPWALIYDSPRNNGLSVFERQP